MPRFKIRTQAIIFDMDGVITHTMPYHCQAWRIVFKRIGLNVPINEIYKREGQKGLDSICEILNTHGYKATLTTANNLLKAKERILKQIVKQRFITGSRRFIRQLSKSGFVLGLVTGTSRHEVRKILPNSLYNLFNVVICGCDVQNGKPHPEPYLKAICTLGVSKKQAVVIENAPLGIQSAKKAGIKCIALQTSLSKEYLSKADLSFLNFKELTNHIKFVYAKAN